VLIADTEGIYDPRDYNDRLLLVVNSANVQHILR
jgi:hypothetical protein